MEKPDACEIERLPDDLPGVPGRHRLRHRLVPLPGSSTLTIRYVHAAHAAKQSNRGQVLHYFGDRSADSTALQVDVDPRGFRF
jgi:hypothetical protein